MNPFFRFRSFVTVWLVLCFAWLPHAVGQPLPFRRALELALQHGGTMAIAAAEQTRARQAYLETRNLYLPQVVLGSGLGGSIGFPLSIEGAAPAIFNVTSQQYLFNPAHREFLRAAKTEWNATSYNTEERRNQVLLEAALAYTELDKVTSTLSVLRQQGDAAQRIEQVVSERVKAGVDSEVELTRARLGAARVRMRIAVLQGTADVLRSQLSQLTGVPANSIETVTESIPALPEVKQEDDLPAKALANSPAVKLAEQNADAKQSRARGEHKLLYPMFDLAGQYALLSNFNNYADFFKKFERHNATFGLAIRFPIFNSAQRAHAEAADAEAIKARREAEGVKNQVSTETLRLQRAVSQLAAAREVARLEHQLARADVDAVQARMQAGTASLRDQENARLVEHEKYAAFLDTSYALDRAQIQLLRSTGELEKWALP